MGTQGGERIVWCPCYENDKEYQTIVDLKDAGLVIYRQTTRNNLKAIKADDVECTTSDEDIFILHNTKDAEILSADIMPAFEQNKISCPRCRHIIENAKRLLEIVPKINKNDIMGVCDHCRRNISRSPCRDCDKAVKKFITSKDEVKDTKRHIKMWLSKIHNLLRDVVIGERNIFKQKPTTYSDIDFDNLHHNSPVSLREPEVTDLFYSEILKTGSTKTVHMSDRSYFSHPAFPKAGKKVARFVDYTEYEKNHEKSHFVPSKDKRFYSISQQDLSYGAYENTSLLDLPYEDFRGRKLITDQELKKHPVSPAKYHSEESFVPLEKYLSDEMLTTRSKHKLDDKYVPRDKHKPDNKLIPYAKYERADRILSHDRYPSDEILVPNKKYTPKDTHGPHEKHKAGQRLVPHGKYMPEDTYRPRGKQMAEERLTTPHRKYKSEETIRKRDSEEALLTSISGIIEDHLRQDFGYFFPHEVDEKIRKKHASSSELIKDTQDMLKVRSEEERIRQEEKRKRKEEEQEQKRVAREKEKLLREEAKWLAAEAKRLVEEETRRVAEKGKKRFEEEEQKWRGGEAPRKLAEEEERKHSEKQKKSSKSEKVKEPREERKITSIEKPPPREKSSLHEKAPKETSSLREKTPTIRKPAKDKPSPSEKSTLPPSQGKTLSQLKTLQGKSLPEKSQEKESFPTETPKVKESPSTQKVKEPMSKSESKKLPSRPEPTPKLEPKEKPSKPEPKEELKDEKQEKEPIRETERKGVEIKEPKSEQIEKPPKPEAKEKFKDEKQEKEPKREMERKGTEVKDRKSEQKEKTSKPESKEKSPKPEPKEKLKEEIQGKEPKKEKERKGTDVKDPKSESKTASKPSPIAGDNFKKLLNEDAKMKEEGAKQQKQQQENERKAREEAEKKLKEMDRNDKAAIKATKKTEEEKPKPEKKQETPTTKDLNITQIKLKKPSGDDLILQLVKLKQAQGPRLKAQSALDVTRFLERHKRRRNQNKGSLLCTSSDFELDLESIANKKEEIKVADIIIGPKLFKYKPPIPPLTDKEEVEKVLPILFKSTFKCDEVVGFEEKKEESPLEEPEKNHSPVLGPTKGSAKGAAKGIQQVEQDIPKGIVRYALSDRSFIDKGWTMLPTEKVVRKMNVYRMRPAHPEFDWFEHNKNKRLMTYDTGEKLAEFDDNGRGRWYYKNGRLALDYYDAEEINAQQRFVVYSSGEPDERGRSRPLTLLATFDYLGNGIVFDHSGKIRLKYNQTEGVVLDRSIGPVSHWKWHTLNDPPVLQQVMIDTQMPHKDPDIVKLGGHGDINTRPDNEEMLAIEFDNFIKEKSKKLTQKFKPFQIKMKALKINEAFSLRVLDQATIYLIFRDGSANLKLNIGMILDHKEIVDTDTAEVGEVSSNMERLPARTDSLAGLQRSVAHAQRVERLRVERERRLRPAAACASADRLAAAAARPLRAPFRTVAEGTSVTTSVTTSQCMCRKPSSSNLYYDTRLF